MTHREELIEYADVLTEWGPDSPQASACRWRYGADPAVYEQMRLADYLYRRLLYGDEEEG